MWRILTKLSNGCDLCFAKQRQVKCFGWKTKPSSDWQQTQYNNPHLLVSTVTPSMSLEHLRAPHGVLPSGQQGLQGQVSDQPVFLGTEGREGVAKQR